ncbi:MAG: Rossmann-like fold-containing protein [Alphaproteobacteria bacterium]
MFDTILNTVNAFSSSRLEPWRDLKETLFVGEGNLSFAKSLLFLPCGITSITATTFEKQKEISDETKDNATILHCHGATVFHGVDAARLNDRLGKREYNTIIFQFPNVGSRDSKYGQNPNHIMIRKFLENAKDHLSAGGKILITAVDAPYYDGVFRFEDAANFAGCKITETYPFDPRVFRGYSHINTLDDESAIKDHKRFVTRVFIKDE